MVLGVLGSIGFILYGIVMGGVGNTLLVIMGAVIGIICSFLAWLFLLAARELFYLFIHVEETTRNTAECITKERI